MHHEAAAVTTVRHDDVQNCTRNSKKNVHSPRNMVFNTIYWNLRVPSSIFAVISWESEIKLMELNYLLHFILIESDVALCNVNLIRVNGCVLGTPESFNWIAHAALHIRSMWETICDCMSLSWSGWNFGPNSTEYPYSEILVSEYPPSPENWNLGRSWQLWLFQFQNTLPPPRKFKFRQILGTLLFSYQNTPPYENWNLGRSWHFDFSVSEYPPSPPKIEI